MQHCERVRFEYHPENMGTPYEVLLGQFGRHVPTEADRSTTVPRPDRVALTAALMIAGYWFAYLHTPAGSGALPGTLLLGRLYSLPISYLWLRGGLESAIDFHFWIDFVRFATAYLGGP